MPPALSQALTSKEGYQFLIRSVEVLVLVHQDVVEPGKFFDQRILYKELACDGDQLPQEHALMPTQRLEKGILKGLW